MYYIHRLFVYCPQFHIICTPGFPPRIFVHACMVLEKYIYMGTDVEPATFNMTVHLLTKTPDSNDSLWRNTPHMIITVFIYFNLDIYYSFNRKHAYFSTACVAGLQWRIPPGRHRFGLHFSDCGGV